MTHTPAPWLVEKPSADTPHIWITAKDDHGGVAKLETCNHDDGLGERHTAEDWANARLIAAAPDLLAALVALVPADFDEHPGDFTEEWHKARAAIARATSKEASHG